MPNYMSFLVSAVFSLNAYVVMFENFALPFSSRPGEKSGEGGQNAVRIGAVRRLTLARSLKRIIELRVLELLRVEISVFSNRNLHKLI
jgi:hypothetical protein